MSIYTNHVGYTPGARKVGLVGGKVGGEFELVDADDGTIVRRGGLTYEQSEIGAYSTADFSDVTTPGRYVLRTDREASHPFRIGEGVYADAVTKMVGYFRLQRCGDTRDGYNGPCHCDDGVRADDFTFRDVAGGWHDACDLRKWVPPTIFGMIGLERVYHLLSREAPPGASSKAAPSVGAGLHERIRDELRWGNRYFLAMQDDSGYVMRHCGGDTFVHSDNNRWTDNVPNSGDERTIDVSPADTAIQWIYVLVQARMAKLFGSGAEAADPAYAARCRTAAERCLARLTGTRDESGIAVRGAAAAALVEMSTLDAANADRYIERAAAHARAIMALQLRRQADSRSPVWGFFLEEPAPGAPLRQAEPHRDVWRGCWPLFGLVSLAEARPDHPDADRWRAAVERYCENYLAAMCRRNAFRIAPHGLYRRPPRGARRIGGFWYRWFMEVDQHWYVGNNALVASAGVGLARAAALLKRPEWRRLAQAQLDWVFGCNSFNASTVMDVGYNNPQHMFGLAHDPPTPFLPGAVMNGIGGDEEDKPRLRPGAWQETEYWTPMVCYTMWLAGLLSEGDS
jgi:hypothetical protein